MANRTDDVIHYILHEIHSGNWKPGSRILSQMTLTRILKCSRTTVERAAARLVDGGVLESRRGSGTFVRGAELRRADEIREITVIAGQLDHLQRSSFAAMFIGLDAANLPVRWLTAEQAFANIPDFRRRRSAVIAYMPDPPQLMLLEELRALQIPILLINRTYGGFDYVTTDTDAGLRSGISYLAGKAGRDAEVSLVSYLPDQKRPYLAERVIASYEICMELGLNLQPERIVKRDFEREGEAAYEAIADLLSRRSKKPLAIIAPNLELADKCLEIGSRFRKQCGKDFFLLTFDAVRFSGSVAGVGVLSQQYALFRPRIEQWVRRIVNGDRSFFASRVPARLFIM